MHSTWIIATWVGYLIAFGLGVAVGIWLHWQQEKIQLKRWRNQVTKYVNLAQNELKKKESAREVFVKDIAKLFSEARKEDPDLEISEFVEKYFPADDDK